MAKLNVYTLHDVKALQYNPPFYFPNDALAKRTVADLVSDPNTVVGRHPSDFKLYRLGTYEDQSGLFNLFPIMEHVCDCISLVPPPHPDMFNKPNGYAGFPTHGPGAEAK